MLDCRGQFVRIVGVRESLEARQDRLVGDVELQVGVLNLHARVLIRGIVRDDDFALEFGVFDLPFERLEAYARRIVLLPAGDRSQRVVEIALAKELLREIRRGPHVSGARAFVARIDAQREAVRELRVLHVPARQRDLALMHAGVDDPVFDRAGTAGQRNEEH